jgi:hypothetical protein
VVEVESLSRDGTHKEEAEKKISLGTEEINFIFFNRFEVLPGFLSDAVP